MTEYLIQDTTLNNIADAIRTRSGTNIEMTPEEMAKYILSVNGNHTNVVKTSTSDGTAIFNSTGYQDNSYWSSGNPNTVAKSGYTSTGNIYLPKNINSIFVKGATWQTGDTTCRFICGAVVNGLGYVIGANGQYQSFDDFFVLETLGTNYYKFTLTDMGKSNFWGKYYRFTFKGTGANLIITHDQLIW